MAGATLTVVILRTNSPQPSVAQKAITIAAAPFDQGRALLSDHPYGARGDLTRGIFAAPTPFPRILAPWLPDVSLQSSSPR